MPLILHGEKRLFPRGTKVRCKGVLHMAEMALVNIGARSTGSSAFLSRTGLDWESRLDLA